MFKLISLLIWIIGLAAVTLGILFLFGYKVNFDYLLQNKEKCREQWNICVQDAYFRGTDNARCANDCLNSNIIIKRK